MRDSQCVGRTLASCITFPSLVWLQNNRNRPLGKSEQQGQSCHWLQLPEQNVWVEPSQSKVQVQEVDPRQTEFYWDQHAFHQQGRHTAHSRTPETKSLKNSLKRLICIAALKARIPEACLLCSAGAQPAALPLVQCTYSPPCRVASWVDYSMETKE